MTYHSKIGASSMDRWATCPGSVVLSDGIESRSSVYAQEGTAAHALAEHILNACGPKGRASVLVGDEFTYDDHGEQKTVVVEQEMADAVQVYIDHIDSVIMSAPAAARVRYEHKFDLGQLYDGLFGTSDCVVWLPDNKELHVIDYKHGEGKPVDVFGNPQLRYYAVGALMTTDYKPETIVITVVQPRCNHRDGPVRTERIAVMDLMEWTADLVDAAKRVEEARWRHKASSAETWSAMYLRAGDHCRWCPAQATQCPLMKSKAQELAKQAFAPGLAYDPKQLAETLEWLPILEAWIKNVREFAYGEAEKGSAIPGHKLVEKVARGKLIEAKVIDLAEALGVAIEELYDKPALKGITEVKKMAPGKNDKERAAVIEPYIARESSGHTLVHESDKRPAIKVDAKSAFSAAE